MITVQDSFSTSYQEARAKFLQGAAAAGLKIGSYAHPLKGVNGEDLAMDWAYEGPSDAKSLLMVSSGCHGVEGYCGSGVQVFALTDEEWHAHVGQSAAAGVAVMYVHALNPHGFSFKRRVTQENVDLNRNFRNFSKPLPANPAYAEVHSLALPEVWPPNDEAKAKIDAFVQARGLFALQSAVSTGQHIRADGLFFGGIEPTWSNRTLRELLRSHVKGRQNLAWIDLHTGLGPSGHGERIHAAPSPDPASLERARDWWGGQGATPITSIYDGSSTSAAIEGMITQGALDECPGTTLTAIAMEYGTVPVMGVIGALQGDHWAHRERLNGRVVDPALQAHITQTIWDAFYVQTDEWKGQIVSQARQSMFQAIEGLART